MDTEDGQIFIKNLAYFVRTHEKALANALQLQRQAPRQGHGSAAGGGQTSPTATNSSMSSTSATFAAALSLPYLNFTSHSLKPAKLTLTPHHLYYLLSRFEELGIAVGPMNVRLENIHTDSAATNYVSFLSQAQRKKSRNSDRASIHSQSSIRSVMSGMSSLWSSLSLSSNSAEKIKKQKALIQEELKYLYSAFTKIPCLRLAPDHKARLIAGYEEFPFDSAVPLFAFKNLSALEIYDVDFRQFYGWDRLAEQLRSLTLKRAGIDDPLDLIVNVVLDDMDKRRRRSAKTAGSPTMPCPTPSPGTKHIDINKSESAPSSPGSTERRSSADGSPQSASMVRAGSAGSKGSVRRRHRSQSPSRPASSRYGSSYGHVRSSTPNIRRSSGSSGSSVKSNTPRGSSSNLLSLGVLPSSKWRFLRHLSLADNSLTSISTASLAPLADTLQSLDLSANLFTEIPDSLATLTSLRALNLSNCMIESLHSLSRNPLPAITTINLRGNRLGSLAGIERLLSLERLDLRENKLTDPTELARLTGIPEMQAIWVSKNPFVKTHGNYRVTIFNLFRRSPGYTEDIVLDSNGPGYGERKHLVDRVPEARNVPVVRPPLEDESDLSLAASLAQAAGERAFDEQAPAPAPAVRSKSEYTVTSNRRRKGPKRRIVELSQNEVLPYTHSDPAIAPPPRLIHSAHAPILDPAKAPSHGNSDPNAVDPDETPTRKPSTTRHSSTPFTLDQRALTPLETDVSPSYVLRSSDAPAVSPPEFNISGDLYRKKIEALKNDFGNGWLSALNDESWDNHQHIGTSPPSMRPTTTTVRTPSQGIVSTGRTLG